MPTHAPCLARFGFFVVCLAILTTLTLPPALAAQDAVSTTPSSANINADDSDGTLNQDSESEAAIVSDEGELPASSESEAGIDWTPAWLVLIGIVSVLSLIIGLKLNAFLALLISAILVSVLVGRVEGIGLGERMDAVVDSFGSSAAGVGIVIAMAAIIGKCMLDSGSADRIVRSAVKATGEKKASLGLMISGFVLAIPVFFDTVFYLLVPLARSLHRRTGKHYLRYLMAIATGGCITHTLVPPTPGPLLVAAILGVDIGMMMMIGAIVAIPSAILGLLFSIYVDKKMPIPMRPLSVREDRHQPLAEEKLPGLFVSLLPVLLPVVMIGAGTLATTLADREDRAAVLTTDVESFDLLAERFAAATEKSPAGRILASDRITAGQRERLREAATDDIEKQRVVSIINDALLDPDFYTADAFADVPMPAITAKLQKANQLRMKPVDRRRMNRALLDAAYPELIAPQRWDSPMRKTANSLGLWSNPNFALLIAALTAMLTFKIVRSLSWRDLGVDVEESLMSGGVIILITAAGGAFGAMLSQTGVGETIQQYFAGKEAAGIAILLLAWSVSAILKVAQGSSTVAMIVGAGMIAAIMGGEEPPFHLVYVATAVGSGALMGSWMNDSGFWVFTKMGGLTEGESLRCWTPLLATLSIGGLFTTIVLSQILPIVSNTP
ncbi:GntP family permease [Allorhodopirellula solitaria]|uniref:Gnt-II system L-idonate transporter n=1 Tax=Allorhodopirellula solitaria TaxID=2527987 RepID=A0A5C5X8U7_9BACT|nr:SLC13 family permease [Allorhodopirellula solitaria]TWT59258.1 Gnt-II system L-idonate transporter [Allorhodopirellula solitaria]